MLSGEGNAGERQKTNKQTKGLISQKKTTLHVTHTFFVHFFAVVLYDYNVKLAETSTCSRSLFFTAAHCFGGPSISHFVTAATKSSCCSSNKKCLFCFLSLALDLCRPFSRWALLACRLLCPLLCLSLALHSKFLDTTIDLSLIL